MGKRGPTVPPMPWHFWNKVAIGDGCWEWQANRVGGKYGQFIRDGIPRQAHRVAWEITFGPIPEGILVCHHCDNPPCCRPDHLFLGTNKDNSQDMVGKGRHKEQRKTSCPKGHPLDGRLTSGKRYCLTCNRENQRAFKAARRAG